MTIGAHSDGRFAKQANRAARESYTLRGLLKFKPGANGGSIPIEEVQTFIAEVNNGTALTTASVAGNRGGQPPAAIALNESVAGQLNPDSDVLPDGSFFDAYVFAGQQGQRIAVEMVSQDLDAYLIVLSEGDDSLYLEDDDSAGELNARIIATLPADGDYIILANSFGRGEQGQYALRLSEVGSGSAVTTPSPPPTDALLLQESGLLAQGDAIAPDGTLYDEFIFEGEAGQLVTITLVSPEFDTYLAVVDSGGNLVAENDDIAPGDTNSEVAFALPSSGSYIVIVNGYSQADQGAYILTIR